MKPSKVGRSRTDAESLIEMMATVGLDASDLTAFRDMNSTDFNMAADGCWPVLILRSLKGYSASLFLAGSDFPTGRFAAPWCDWLTLHKQHSVPLCGANECHRLGDAKSHRQMIPTLWMVWPCAAELSHRTN